MRTQVLFIAMTFLAGVNGAEAETVVPVCVGRNASLTSGAAALRNAEKLFANAGIATKWYDLDRCPNRADAILITLETHPRDPVTPRAMAYAFPYEGSHIVVLIDRVLAFANSSCISLTQYVLAYVMAHEVCHILEGVAHHSDTGIMKGSFGRDEAFQIRTFSLQFAADDIELMHIGIESRLTHAEVSLIAPANRQ